MKTINDPIHGHIELHPLLMKIIDTPQFQRLRFIKQLGTKYLVYPGATHTRFEHSLGVAHLAGCLLKTLHENQPELNITKQDFLCVQIAALCHDMGHGPFSHLFDGMFIPKVQPGKCLSFLTSHEEASVQMFHCMKRMNGLDKEMKFYGLNLPEDIKFIEELILKGQKDGKWSMKGRTEDKSFLYEIVANKVNGIDVDKWDYLVRDCYYLGIPCGFDHQRLLKSARVCNVNGRKHICFRDKVADNIYGMFHTRYTLHRQALQHKIGYIIDVKINEALVEADDKLFPDLKISDATDDMLKYTKLTDHVFDQILNQSESNSAHILHKVVERQLPKFVGEARLNEKYLKEMLTKRWEGMVKKHNLDPEVLRFCVLDMGFGEVGKEPIDNVHFYSKSDLKTASKMKKYQVSSLKPEKFHEFVVRVYYDPKDQTHQREVQQEAEKCFHEWCKINKNKFIDFSHDSGEEEDADEEGKENEDTSTSKIFNDPIHGQFELSQLLVKIIDTPEFQRLRHIKQLGGAYLVYPGATHTRFEHSLGDCHYLGIPNSFDHQRMLKSARVCKVKEENHICFRDKMANDIYDMFHTRYTLYHQAYKHKIVTIIEDKITKALLEAKDTLEISPISPDLSPNHIRQKIENITNSSRKRKMPSSEDEQNAKFIKLTDHIFEKILYSTEDNLKDARKELEDVVMRRLPKCVGETRLQETEENELQTQWNEALDEWNKLYPNLFLYKEDFMTEVIQLDYNKKAENPINHVYFYRKRNHTKGFRIKNYEVSSLLPKKFTELVGRVYYTKNSDEEEKAAKECFKWWQLGMCAIELYDKPEFKGTKCVITRDCLSLDHCIITEVRSCKVIRGVWKLWKGCDNNKDDYLLKEGEYHNLKAMSDGRSTASASAPAPIPDPAWCLECVPFEIHLYEKVNFEGPNFVTTIDCCSLDGYGIKEVRSCKVLSGVWDFFEGRDYNKPRYQLQKGEYPNSEAWSNGGTAPALSFKRVLSYKIQLYEKENFEEKMHETTVDCCSLDGCGINEVRSCKVLSGVWEVYEGSGYAEPSYQLSEGEYPDPGSWCASDPAAPVLSVKRVTE
ncbi:hypothetical protein Q8A67_005326 [Cirrhinus molitorella]|uniref:HD domain-containing protein n=1 Tax=Cirrhinus molitorella TaxID=172907 RepID=A0AA88Q2F3_9TELE|nr:hypothetical protein Q8A67_005326 [Cirrhinus molitorella]